MKKMNQILPKIVSSYGLQQNSVAAQITTDFQAEYSLLFPDAHDSVIQKIYYKNLCIVIFVCDSTWAHRLFLEKYTIISKLQKKYGETKLKDIIIKIQ